MITLQALRAANIARNKIWDPENKLDLEFAICELGGEIGELCNLLKKQERVLRGIRGSLASLDEIKDETADVVICIDLAMMHANLPCVQPLADNYIPLKEICPASLGTALLAGVGYVAEDPFNAAYYSDLYDCAEHVAQFYKFDLLSEVQRKYNLTSERYGLPIRL